ncbi:MAG: CHAD domain-containing protein [Spirochaetes bacterium]|nr:CHAD domain-containing protein [Spirochaetota bacterium]
MRNIKRTYQIIPKQRFAFSQIIAIIAKKYQITAHHSYQRHLVQYDDEDFSIEKSNHYLLLNNQQFEFTDCINFMTSISENKEQTHHKVVAKILVENIQQPVLREILFAKTKSQTLIKMREQKFTQRLFDIYNQDRKLVFKIRRFRYYSKLSKNWINITTITALKGYEKDCQKLIEKIKKLPVDINKVVLGPLLLEQYPKFPHLSSANGLLYLSKVCQNTIKNSKKFRKGVLTEKDIEYLHEYRVNFRKFKSLLKQCGKIFSYPLFSEIKNEITEFIETTNQMRDLDVLLSQKKEFTSLINEIDKKKLAPLFDFLKKERTQAFHQVKEYLLSDAYQLKIKKINRLITYNHFYEQCPELQNISLKKLSDQLVYKSYLQLKKKFNKITEQSLDEDYHSLRIEGKKLRYLINYFGFLYPERQVDNMINQLKVIQNFLGKHQDLVVQADIFTEIKNKMQLSTTDTPIQSISDLIKQIILQKENMAQDLHSHFNQLLDQKNIDQFRILFLQKKLKKRKNDHKKIIEQKQDP